MLISSPGVLYAEKQNIRRWEAEDGKLDTIGRRGGDDGFGRGDKKSSWEKKSWWSSMRSILRVVRDVEGDYSK